MKKSFLLVAVAVLALPLASAQAASGVAAALDMMRTTNLVTLGDYYGNGIDVEGKARIGGNLYNGTTIGFGHSANSSQSARTSNRATLTVYGSVNGTVNLSYGAGAGNGSYGIVAGGNVNSLTLNTDRAALIQVGGSVTNTISLKAGSVMNVAGSLNGVDTSTGSTIKVGGSVGGQANIGNNTSLSIKGDTSANLSIGNNAQVAVGGSATGGNINLGTNSSLKVTKNISSANEGTGSTIVAGGSLGNFNASGGSTVSMGSYNGSNKVAVTSGSKVYVGSSISAAENNGGTLEVRGNIGDMQGYSANSITKVTGSIGGNGNGIGNKPSYIYAGSSIAGSQNANSNAANVHANYNYNANGAVAGPTTLGTPTAPTAPTATDLGTNVLMPLSTLQQNMKSLSTALLGQGSVNASASLLTNQNGTQRATIKVTSTGNNAIAVLNVNQSLFSSFSEIDYQFDNASTVVVINVLNSGNTYNATTGTLRNTNYTYNWNMNGIGSLASGNKNQQIIWNFADASNLNLNRETWGSFLAPNADVYNSNSINGSLVAKVFHQGGEVHLGTFNGFDGFLVPSGGSQVGVPGSVPEPASWMTMLAGFGALGTMIRRHKSRERALAKAA